MHVERRPVDRAATGTENQFRERTIEAEEKAEEAVVPKEARVKEELVVKKEVREIVHLTEDQEDELDEAQLRVERRPLQRAASDGLDPS